MSDRTRDRLATLIPLLIASILFFWGIDWGLPSRDVDSKLFGDRTPWTGAEILALLDQNQFASTTRGADVDSTPILDRSKPIILNDTDAKRAEIVQRYRLMSGQPDEFIQFKALAEMAGRSGIDRFDPRLYQYGGLWIYPVGGLLKVCSMVGLVELKSDRAFYLDHPEEFGKFYVVARCYSAFWGLVLVWSVFQITKKITNNRWLSTVAAILIALTPVVMSSAQEAKPHLAGAALTMLAVLAASRHVETGKAKWSLLTCALCAMAGSMVLSAILSCAMLPVMVWLERKNRTVKKPVWKDCLRLFEMFVLVGVVFTIFNPFLVYNGLFRPELLRSNLGNSAAMYGISIYGIRRAIEILGAAMTWVVMIGAVLGAIVLVIRWMISNRNAKRAAHEVSGFDNGPAKPAYCVRGSFSDWVSLTPILPLLLVTMLPTLAMFVLLANEKPMEFARFGIVISAYAVVVACSMLRLLLDRWRRYTLVGLSLLALFGLLSYLLTSWRNLNLNAHFNAQMLQSSGKSRTIGLWHEPAPWSCPPVDLFADQIVLLPPTMKDFATIYIAPGNLSSPISLGRQRVSWKHNEWDYSWLDLTSQSTTQP